MAAHFSLESKTTKKKDSTAKAIREKHCNKWIRTFTAALREGAQGSSPMPKTTAAEATWQSEGGHSPAVRRCLAGRRWQRGSRNTTFPEFLRVFLYTSRVWVACCFQTTLRMKSHTSLTLRSKFRRPV